MSSAPEGAPAPFRPALLASRATEVIAEASRALSGGKVLLPAMYCAEVVDAILATGTDVAYYDLRLDLTAPAEEVGAAMTSDVGLVIWHHPFGCYCPRPGLGDVTVLDDACYTLRTALSMPWPAEPGLMVFSPRKELGWPQGGLAVGRLAALMRPRVRPACPDIARRWQHCDVRREVTAGAAATMHAIARLGGFLPPDAANATVLTMLPLLSDRRDESIAILRAAGVAAWCWLRPPAGCAPGPAPRAWWLWQRLLLVPLPRAGSRTYDILEALALRRWPDTG